MEHSSPRARGLAWALLTGLAVAFIVAARGALVPFLLGAALAYVLHPPVRYLEKRAVPRSVAIFILYIGAAVLVWAALRLVLPGLGREIHELADVLPRQTERLEDMTRRTVQDVRNLEVPAARDLLEAILLRVEQLLERFAARLADVLVGLAGGMFNLLLAPVLAFFILRDWEKMNEAMLAALTPSFRRHVVTLGGRMNDVLHAYIRGQLLVSAIVGAVAAAGLALLDVPHALIIGAFAGLTDLIPYFGPIIGTLPAVAVALTRSPKMALYVLLFFIAVQQLEGGILSPRIVGKSVGLHPLSVIAAVLVGAQWFGVIGMVIAVPIASGLKVVLSYIREEWRNQADSA